MAKIEMKNAAGKKAASVEVADSVFGITPNIPVLHQVVVAQLAHRRSGTQSTKTRSEVSGGGKKPFKQKGTGNARQGTVSSTTPRPAPKCPPVSDTASIISFLTSLETS